MNDADLEMHDLTVAANTMARLKRTRGICFHGWTQTKQTAPYSCRCMSCGKVFPSEQDARNERDELENEYL